MEQTWWKWVLFNEHQMTKWLHMNIKDICAYNRVTNGLLLMRTNVEKSSPAYCHGVK